MHRYSKYIFLLLLITVTACRHQQPRAVTEEQFRETQKHMEEVNKIMIQKDRQHIVGWLNRNNLEMTETKTGLWYSIDRKGEGPKAETGEVAVINYSVSLLDGTPCYSSRVRGPKQFKIGQGGVESGLEEGILLLHEGDKATFVMPPHLAYGLPGDGDKIPAHAIIVYKVELVALQ